jgi:hypothetical protein
MEIKKVDAWEVIGKARTVSVVGKDNLERVVFEECLIEALVSNGIKEAAAYYICSNIALIEQVKAEAAETSIAVIEGKRQGKSYAQKCEEWYDKQEKQNGGLLLVRIARKTKGEGWGNEWTPTMDTFIGANVHIDKSFIVPEGGFLVESAGGFVYPFECFRILNE